jgi:hypothetical protein
LAATYLPIFIRSNAAYPIRLRFGTSKRECPGEMLFGSMKDIAISRPATKKSTVEATKLGLSEFFYTTGGFFFSGGLKM